MSIIVHTFAPNHARGRASTRVGIIDWLWDPIFDIVRVYDVVAQHYTLCHSVPAGIIRRIDAVARRAWSRVISKADQRATVRAAAISGARRAFWQLDRRPAWVLEDPQACAIAQAAWLAARRLMLRRRAQSWRETLVLNTARRRAYACPLGEVLGIDGAGFYGQHCADWPRTQASLREAREIQQATIAEIGRQVLTV